MIKITYSSITKTFLVKCVILLIATGFGNYNSLFAQDTFDELFEITERISLEDPLGLMPTSVTTDKDGNFVTTNGRTHKVSIFTPEGNLLFSYGREGKGPGDFLHPIKTISLSNGQLLTAELGGKLSLFTSDGDSLIKIYNAPVIPLVEVHQIDEDHILLVGRKIVDKEFKYLHILNLKSGLLEKSFLKLPFSITQDYGGVLTTMMNLVSATVAGENITALITPFPKIYQYNQQGMLQKTVPLSLDHFKEIENISVNQLSPRGFNKFVTSYSRINNIFWLYDNTFLLEYYRFTEFNREDNIEERQYNLANVKPDGTLIFDITNTPIIKSVYKSNLFFENPDLESREQLIKAYINKQ